MKQRWFAETAKITAKTSGGGAVLSLLLLIVLVALILGALPRWGYSSGWGYYPSGTLTLILVIVLLLYFTGHL